MQVTNSLSVSQTKAVSTPSVPPIDRSPLPASLNSSSTSVALTPDVVTFSTPTPATEPSDLLPPVPSSGTANDLSPDANQITAEFSPSGVNEDGNDSEVDGSVSTQQSGQDPEEAEEQSNSSSADSNEPSDAGLSRQQQEQVAELAARDAEVKAHERAHQAAGGQYTGSISFSYQTGPDGKRYAIGGEVPIDASPISGDPQATIDKMRVVRSAALAPADPSSQDRSVASTAGRLMVEAQMELAEQKSQERAQSNDNETNNGIVPNVGQANLASETYKSVVGLETESETVSEAVDELV